MFWFNRRHPDVVFMDRREESHTLCDGRALEIKPDVVGDFRKMPFSDGAFRLVVFDPPHLIHAGESSWLAKKYGKLNGETVSANVSEYWNRAAFLCSSGARIRFQPQKC